MVERDGDSALSRDIGRVDLLAFVDLKTLQDLQRDVSAATKTPTAVLDSTRRAIIGNRYLGPICRLLSSKSRAGKARCDEELKQLVAECLAGKNLVIRQCPAGLTRFACPILNQGIVVCYLIGGALFERREHLALFHQWAETSGVSAADAAAVLHSVPMKAEEELRQTAELLARAVSVAVRNSMLMMAITHEVKGALTAIKSRADLLGKAYEEKKALRPDLAVRYYNDMMMQCDLINLVIQGAVPGSLSARDLSLEPANVLTEVVIPVINMHRAGAASRRIRLEYQDNLEVPTLHVDVLRLQQVFHNLVNNAVKYAQRNSSVTVVGYPGREVHRFAVINQGIGIPHGWEDSIFEPGVRAPNAIAVNPVGLGLGLAYSRLILEAHGGQLQLSKRSDPTIFVVVLPAHRRTRNGTDPIRGRGTGQAASAARSPRNVGQS